jgi:diacylglycerol kinase family enzyme
MKSIIFLINKLSGRGGQSDYEHRIREYMEGKGVACTFFYFPLEDAEIKLKNRIRDTAPYVLVAVGGDGTVRFAAGLLLGTSVRLGIIPAGSLNGMARELDVPADLNENLRILLEGHTIRTDVITITDEGICIHLADVGLNALLVKYFQQGRVRGKLGYAMACVKALIRRTRMKVTVVCGEKEMTRNAVMVLLANARKYGTGAVVNPKGNISDGYFEVVMVKKLGPVSILKMFLKHTRFHPSKIEVIHAKTVSIESIHSMHFQTDGEYIGKVKKLYAEILPGQLNLIVPAESDAMNSA